MGLATAPEVQWLLRPAPLRVSSSLADGISTEAREAVSLGHGSVSLEPIHNLPIFHSIGWQFCAISTHCLGASSPEFQLTVLGVVH